MNTPGVPASKPRGKAALVRVHQWAHKHRAPVVTAALAGVMVVAVLAFEQAGWPFLRQPIAAVLTRAAGVPVTLQGHFRLHLLWRPSVTIEHLHVAAAPGLPVPHLVDASDLQMQWRWLDLWHWQRGQPLRLRALRARSLDARIMRTAEGRASWQFSGAPADPAPLLLPQVGTLTIDAGHVLVDDAPLQTQLEIHLKGGEGQGIGTAAPGYSATVAGRYRALPLRLSVHSSAVLPLLRQEEDPDGGEDGAAPVLDVRVEGEAGESTVRFDGHASALWGARRVSGALRLSGPSLARMAEPLGVTLPSTAPFELSGWLSQGDGVWHLRADRLAIGRSLLGGDFRYDTRRSPPYLSGQLRGPRLALADLGPAVGAEPGAAAVADDRVLPQRRFDLPSLRVMNADVQVDIDALELGGRGVGALRELHARLRLDAGVLHLQDLRAKVADGQLGGSMQLDGRTALARWAADLRLAGIDIASWISGLQAKPGGTLHAYLTGTLTADARVTGSGRSTAEILSTLDGRITLRLGEGSMSHLATELVGLDLAQALGVAIRGDQPLPLRCARVELAVRNGVAEPELAVLDNRDSTLRLDGRVDLRNETLALRAIASPKDVSPLSLRTPVTVGGTLRHPSVGLETKRLAGRVLGAVALGAVVAPAAALLPFVDFGGSNKGADPCAAAGKQVNRG